MAKMVYDEFYGELTFALRAAIRKNNVAPADYTDLEDEFGAGNFGAILAAVKERSTDGMYQMPWPGHGHNGW